MAGPLWPRSRRGSTDEALIRAVYEEHGNALLAYATRLTGDRATAEDVVQETFIRAWRHSDALVNGKGSVRGWLLTVARNIITDRYRAKAARPAEVAESPATPPVEEDHADSVVDTMTVLGALDRLSPEHRDVLTELYYRERSVAEAADSLGIPAGTVKSRSHYALKALRETFREGNRSSVPQQPAGLREVVA
ncbi:sigma-70 family RNA polymerase sigma factor [Streptomyces sp. NBC_01077]|uniref:sigma-70 family RNA polymerase sigma factor n=1 Tax=Streptomyces sp. NBC_01077 TaxID=2903746 RepID=UPI003862F491|nr:sigma-70 family RNA polymerase sigma factor [Streptomyces sp. NBC_01077]